MPKSIEESNYRRRSFPSQSNFEFPFTFESRRKEMANQSPSPLPKTPTNITDLDADSLAHCASYLSLQDISNMAMTSKYLNKVSYSDSIWLRCFRESWPHTVIPNLSGIREAYLARRTAILQFKFADPLVADFYTEPRYFNHIMLDKNDIIFSQGTVIEKIKIDEWLSGRGSMARLSDHKASITCMRLFPLSETYLFRSEKQREENILVTSSRDRSIRLWWKDTCQRCFRGHDGAVTALSDKLLGDGADKVLASGGEDGTVRLWSLGSSGKRGQRALKATLKGHEKPVALMSVARHKSSLLATISKDSKVRVWDTTTSSGSHSSCCVGMTLVPGRPVGMECREALLYVAAGSSVAIIDLRTMQKVNTASRHPPMISSLSVSPSKSLFCTGGLGKRDAQPIAEMDGHLEWVRHLHMDQYKIVSCGDCDGYVNVWEADTGTKLNSFTCCPSKDVSAFLKCSAMAVNKQRIVTSSYGDDGTIVYRDFSNAVEPVMQDDLKQTSKFWDEQSYSDFDDS